MFREFSLKHVSESKLALNIFSVKSLEYSSITLMLTDLNKTGMSFNILKYNKSMFNFVSIKTKFCKKMRAK